ncbi:hypothetical protein [Variovorax paradoxus]|uniref:hypothetical protein n=1 Tax=Variovorax paradoxus TaxID=34073 RepID=UPI003D652A12
MKFQADPLLLRFPSNRTALCSNKLTWRFARPVCPALADAASPLGIIRSIAAAAVEADNFGGATGRAHAGAELLAIQSACLDIHDGGIATTVNARAVVVRHSEPALPHRHPEAQWHSLRRCECVSPVKGRRATDREHCCYASPSFFPDIDDRDTSTANSTKSKRAQRAL